MTILSNTARPVSGVIPTGRKKQAIRFAILSIWGGVVLAGTLSILFSSSRLQSVADVFVHGLVFLVALLAMALTVSNLLRIGIRDAWDRLMSLFPMALGASVLANWIGVWNDGSGAVALPIRQILLFIVTGGFSPLKLGPDALLRFSILALAVLIAARDRSSISTARRVILGVGTWIAGAVILLIPSWASIAMALAGAYPVATAQDALRSLGMVLANSHWSNFQADRFLTGIGNQLAVSVMLWSAAITACVGMILAFLVAYRSGIFARSQIAIQLAWQALRDPRIYGLSSALLVGALSGFGPRGILELDVLPVVLLLLACFSGFGAWTIQKMEGAISDDLQSLRDGMLLALFVFSALLGWPILLCIGALFAMGVIMDLSGQTRDGWIRRTLSVSVAALILVAIGHLFVTRQIQMAAPLAAWGIPWAILIGAALNVPMRLESPAVTRRALLILGIGAVAFVATMTFPVGFAIAALFGLGFVVISKRPGLWARFVFPAILLFGWVVSFLKIMVHS